MKSIFELIKKQTIGLIITFGSLVLVFFLHRIHFFDSFELKVIDFSFKIRGPLSGWASRSPIPKDSLDVVLVDIDDESYRLVPWTWPYPREIWGEVVKNLSKAGAKVVVFDIQFDSPDRQSEYLKGIRKNLQSRGMSELIPAHGDSMFAKAILEAEANGTHVILASKLVQEPTRIPPQYIQYPNNIIQGSRPDYGLVNEGPDKDGFSRKYYTFLQIEQEPGVYYPTLGLKAMQKYLNISEQALPNLNEEGDTLFYGPLSIPMFSSDGRFLVNIYGPTSGVNIGKNEAWKTFNRYPLSNIVDVPEVELNDIDEDTDWMSQFLPGEVPKWIEDIEDPEIRSQLMEELGIGSGFEITNSPFYNKIVMIGVSVEVLHDFKQTSFFNFAGEQNLMPGMEFHANAIQTLIDQNFIGVFGKDISWTEESRIPHILLISALSIIAFFFISFFSPALAGISIIIEILIFVSIAIGLFVNDSLWLVKTLVGKWESINVSGINTSFIIPVIAPVFGIFITYTSNVLYRIIVEQKDKRFLKNTFGTYVSPKLIDQMYDSKQEPKLGGEAGYHTAFFSDIQSFSSFSEVLKPERMVALMNEYLTDMTDILLEHRGTLDKYIGDAIVAFYGAPVPVNNHEFLACTTALAMERHLGKLRRKWKESNEWPELVHNTRHRVGLNSGEMVTGNMGSNMRMNYTMMGDTVNIAARLEASAKQYGVYIQVAENTYATVKDQFEWRFLDNVRVKGKKQPVKVFELISEKGQMDRNYSKIIPVFNEALELYKLQNWDRSLNAFKEAEKLEDKFPYRPTNPSSLYIKRCEYLKDNPPGDNWDGVWNLTAK